jgi:hypothetical protein
MKRSHWVVAGLGSVLMFACSSQKGPAEQAITKIDNTMSAIHDSAAKYAPEHLQSVETQVTAIKRTFNNGDYAGVLAAAPGVSSAVADLRTEARQKESAADAEVARVKQQWRQLSNEVPKLVAGLHTQVDSLSGGHGLPRGVTKASFTSAKDGVASLDTMWTDANNTVSTGDYAGAVTKGQAVKDKATELMKALGMKTS